MAYPSSVLKPEYVRLMATMKFTRSAEIMAAAKRLITYVPRYEDISKKTHVPVIWLAAVGEREDGPAIFTHYFGNGDPLDRPTTDVPRGRGGFSSFEAGCQDALHYDRIDQVTDWSWPGSLYEGEAWNGFGPRAHGKHTGYLWAGTNVYTGGKYVRDNEWDPNADDEQLGIVPMMVQMTVLEPSLQLTGVPDANTEPPAPVPAPLPPPDGLHNAAELQALLNKHGAELDVDGSYGRQTAAAVRAFQTAHHLHVDGIAGTETWAALQAA